MNLNLNYPIEYLEISNKKSIPNMMINAIYLAQSIGLIESNKSRSMKFHVGAYYDALRSSKSKSHFHRHVSTPFVSKCEHSPHFLILKMYILPLDSFLYQPHDFLPDPLPILPNLFPF